MKRYISLLLILSLLAGTAVSCGNTEEAETSGDTETIVETVPEETVPARLDNLPELDYEGTDFTIYIGGSGAYFREELNGEIINDAIYKRQLAAEERLNIHLAEFSVPGGWNGQDVYKQGISTAVQAGDGAYDMATAYSQLAGDVAIAGYYMNILDLPHLDLSREYYSQLLLEQTILKNKLFFVTGDINHEYLAHTTGLIYNKDMAKDQGITEDLYALVHEGKWVLDKLISLTEGIYQDLNGNGEKDDEDRYGFFSHIAWIDGFWQAAGLNWIDVKDGVPSISPLIYSERAVSLVEKMCTFVCDSPDSKLYENGTTEHAAAEGRVLFQARSFNTLSNELYRNSEYTFGFLPFPKYDEQQEQYYSFMEYSMPMISIPKDAKDPVMSSAVIELLAAEGLRLLTPAYFETVMKVKYADSPEDAAMFDLIRSSVTFDLGCVFLNSMNQIAALFRNTVNDNKSTWASNLSSKSKSFETSLETLVQKLDELE